MGIWQEERRDLKTGRSLPWRALTGKLSDFIKMAAVFLIVAWLFYDTALAMLLFLPIAPRVWKHMREKQEEKRKSEGELQFKDFLHSLSASMHAGYAVENAIREAYYEISELYGKNAFIPRELSYMLYQMKLNRSVEEVLEEFGERCGLEDAKSFAGIFKTARKSSGNLVSIMQNTADTIGKKLETQREIRSLVQEKRYEQNIMNVMPLAMILYLRVGNGELMELLYASMAGRLIMSMCLIIYVTAYYMAEKIVDIRL